MTMHLIESYYLGEIIRWYNAFVAINQSRECLLVYSDSNLLCSNLSKKGITLNYPRTVYLISKYVFILGIKWSN